MIKSRTIFLVLIILFLVVGYTQDFPEELVNFLLASGMLAFELIEILKVHKQTDSRPTFHLASNEWISGLVMDGFILYYFLDDTMNAWNICAIVEVLLFGGLYAIRTRTVTYVIEDLGIRNKFNGKLLNASTITNIEFNDDQLAIHTTKYQNELVIKSSNLRSPSWSEVTNDLIKLNKNKN